VTQEIVSIIAIVLTFMVLSRVVGNNPLFRVAQYLFVGVSLGLAFVIVFHQVLRPAIRIASGSTEGAIAYGIPLALGLLLLPRITRRQEYSWLANIPLALIFGVGAALAVGGAIVGTLLPQILDTSSRPLSSDLLTIAGVVVLALGTILTLGTFYYTVPREGSRGQLVTTAAVAGHWLLMVAFGFFFASAVQSYMSALTERLAFVLTVLRYFGVL
jgi:hypothetical protein